MKNAAHSAEAFHWFAEPREIFKEMDLVQERRDKSLGGGGMILRGPREYLSQVD